MVKFYCEMCDEHTPAHIEPAAIDDLNPMPWGDVVCERCKLVIATYSADKPGQLVFEEADQERLAEEAGD